MEILNVAQSSEYFDALGEEREDSAVRVIHHAWLEHSSSLARRERLEPTAPLDLHLLYRAVAATFRDWDPGTSVREVLKTGGHILNREAGTERLRALSDPEQSSLATRFANQVITLSEHSSPQDLAYFVELFLHAIEDRRVLPAILDGSISRNSRQMMDLENW